MIDLRPVWYVIGLLLTVLGAAMLAPMAVDLLVENDDWQVFLFAMALTILVGVSMALANRTPRMEINLRQAFLLTTMSWMIMAAFSALPFRLANINLDYADAYFEAMSGLTTTGSTVIVGLDRQPPGILLWRALLQWIGGLGIVVMAIAILPFLGVGGMQLFRMESSDRSEKIMPRPRQIVGAIGTVYLVLTAACAAAFSAGGMNGFEAVTHAMTTLSTGGFSTSDDSLAHFPNPLVHWSATLFMLCGGLPFILLFQALRGRPLALFRDVQVRGFLILVVLLGLGLAGWRWLDAGAPFADALRESFFNVATVITTTGFTLVDYQEWGGIAVPVFFLLLFVGSCAGSTGGGIKIYRFQVMFIVIQTTTRQLMQPHGVFPRQYNRQELSLDVIVSVMAFFWIYLVSWIVLALALQSVGLDVVTAASGAITALSNVGPGLGTVIGPVGNFSTLPDEAKWLLSLGMMIGRLEMFTVFVLLSPAFWRG